MDIEGVVEFHFYQNPLIPNFIGRRWEKLVWKNLLVSFFTNRKEKGKIYIPNN